MSKENSKSIVEMLDKKEKAIAEEQLRRSSIENHLKAAREKAAAALISGDEETYLKENDSVRFYEEHLSASRDNHKLEISEYEYYTDILMSELVEKNKTAAAEMLSLLRKALSVYSDMNSAAEDTNSISYRLYKIVKGNVMPANAFWEIPTQIKQHITKVIQTLENYIESN